MNAKPLLVLLVFFFLFALFAGELSRTTDLTPENVAIPGGESAGSGASGVMGVMASGSGPCGGSYTVQSGDTLSRIAQTCGVTLAEILSANPNISDPNLIRVGEVIAIPFVASTAAPAPTSPVVRNVPAAAPTATSPAAAPVAPAADDSASAGGPYAPGGMYTVDMEGFPGLVIVTVQIGPQGGKLETVKEVQTDKNGRYTGKIPIPPTAKAGELWIVRLATKKAPSISKDSDPFEIE